MTQKITPFLWYNKEAREAANLYTAVLKSSKIGKISTLNNTPSGTVETVSAELCGLEFGLMSAGPLFKFNPSVSFLILCETQEEVKELWKRLSVGGKTLMELKSYPFSALYGWTEDRYGLSWQIMFAGDREISQCITPTLMFVGNVCGKAEEAIKFYTAVFKNSKVGDILYYGKDQAPDKEGTVTHASFILEGQEFAAMDSARQHDFAFNEAISFVVNCKTQQEVDYYWEKLSADPKAEICGWLKDTYGLSWQIVPTIMQEMLGDKDPWKVARVTEAFLKMKKLDIATLQRAYRGE